eukprot:2741751-Pyramimonas_sp.AAC.1
MLGDIQYPKSKSGLCFESDYGLLRFLPTKRDPAMRLREHFPSPLSQRRDGERAPPKEFCQMGQATAAGQPSAIGSWPTAETVRLWDQPPTHRDFWPLTVVFNGRVLSRFSCRDCRDGTPVSRQVPRFTDIDKVVPLQTIMD